METCRGITRSQIEDARKWFRDTVAPKIVELKPLALSVAVPSIAIDNARNTVYAARHGLPIWLHLRHYAAVAAAVGVTVPDRMAWLGMAA